MYEDSFAALMAAAAGVIIVVVLLLIAFAVFYFIGMWKLYVKAGEPGWKCLIPFYNDFTLVKMVGLNWYWFLLAIASTIVSVLGISSLNWVANIAAIFADIMICYNMAKKLHKDTGWIVLAVLFGLIVLPIMGYSKNVTWDKEAVVTPNAFFDKKEN